LAKTAIRHEYEAAKDSPQKKRTDGPLAASQPPTWALKPIAPLTRTDRLHHHWLAAANKRCALVVGNNRNPRHRHPAKAELMPAVCNVRLGTNLTIRPSNQASSAGRPAGPQQLASNIKRGPRAELPARILEPDTVNSRSMLRALKVSAADSMKEDARDKRALNS